MNSNFSFISCICCKNPFIINIKINFFARIFIIKIEFYKFRKETQENQTQILEALKTLSPRVDRPQAVSVERSLPPVAVVKDDAGPKIPEPLLPQYQQLVDKHFDPADGFRAEMDFPALNEKNQETGALVFKIYVPQKFSNAAEAHWKYYQNDLRAVALKAGAIAQGIDDYCRRVALNLKYNKQVVTK